MMSGIVLCCYMLDIPQMPLSSADMKMMLLEKTSLLLSSPKSSYDLGSFEATVAFDYRDKKLR